MALDKTPGLTIGFWKDGFVWVKGYGYSDLENRVPASPATAYRLASVSKSMTAVAIMQLVEKGKIDLDAQGALLTYHSNFCASQMARDAYRSAAQYTLDYSERAVRHALRGIPDGTYEAEDRLIPSRAKLYSRLHPRCGPSFLLIVMIGSAGAEPGTACGQGIGKVERVERLRPPLVDAPADGGGDRAKPPGRFRRGIHPDGVDAHAKRGQRPAKVRAAVEHGLRPDAWSLRPRGADDAEEAADAERGRGAAWL